jgi:hypothetical protein
MTQRGVPGYRVHDLEIVDATFYTVLTFGLIDAFLKLRHMTVF